MAVKATGIKSSIWNNNIKSMLLLAVYPFLLAGIVWAVAFVVGYGGSASMSAGSLSVVERANDIVVEFLPTIVTVVSVWFVVSYFFHGKMMRALSHSHPVTRQEEPELYNLLENLCISQGMKMPRMEIIETHARNAFASGVDEKSFCVTVTRGLIQSLSKDEVEGVLAHELTHIQNRDVRLLMVCVIFTGMIGFAAQMVWSVVRYSIYVPRRSDRKGGGVLLLFIILAILWAGYLATIVTRFALTRRREYMADAGAVAMTRNPEAMMRALMRIAGMDRIPKVADDVSMMCIENSKPFFGLFMTHPPIKDRIEAISKYTDTPIPDMQEKVRVRGKHRFVQPVEARDDWIIRKRRIRNGRKNPWVR